jgi:small subunit ribosomal protein SAe
MVDMYFYRDPEEQERDAEEALEEGRKAVTTGAGEDEFATGGGDWDAEPTNTGATGGDWDAAAGGEWGATGGESWDATAA